MAPTKMWSISVERRFQSQGSSSVVSVMAEHPQWQTGTYRGNRHHYQDSGRQIL